MDLPSIPPPTPPGTTDPAALDPLLEPPGAESGGAEDDPSLRAAVLEIEAHVATEGWDHPARLFALVETARLVQHEPQLAAALSLDPDAAAGSLTPVEQDPLRADQSLEQQLEAIAWPEPVAGCAAVVERFVLPPGADEELPDESEAQVEFAREHPERQEVRLVAAATRRGSTFCALRMRVHDDPASVVGGADLVPGLLALLRETLVDVQADDATDADPASTGAGGQPLPGQGVPGTMEDPDPYLVDPRGRRPDEESHP